jgi:hypothetical protein
MRVMFTTQTGGNMVSFLTTDLTALRTLSTESLERRLAIQRAARDPLRYRAALKTVLDERENLDHIVCPS